jgi:predicted histidine transporter YuiF (NhaC family)
MNAVLVAVILMIILSLCRLNVVLALFVGALAGGLVAGLGFIDTISIFTSSIVGGAEIALSYALLGGFAALIAYSGITDLFIDKILQMFKKSNTKKARVIAKSSVIVTLLIISMLSQNLVPVHIAFIPILIPPLLSLFNEFQIDRRLIAVVLTFGLTFTYVVLPYGFGNIFQNTVVTSFNNAGVDIVIEDVTANMWMPALGFVVGLIIAVIYFRKPRQYRSRQMSMIEKKNVSKASAIIAVIAIIVTFAVQLVTDSMIFGAIAGILIFFFSFQFKWTKLDDELVKGIQLMAYIGIVMLAANGFAGVITESGHVGPLVKGVSELLADNKAFIVISMLIVGLLVTLGIGSSFATIPIIGAIFIPLGIELGLSLPAIIAIVGTSGALGDAGSPASDSTLGPTAGLNMDKQHDHIWDTCVPTFIFLNIPVVITGFIAAMIL